MLSNPSKYEAKTYVSSYECIEVYIDVSFRVRCEKSIKIVQKYYLAGSE